MSYKRDLMKFVKTERKVEVRCANGGKVNGEGFGRVYNGNSVSNVMYVPGLASNSLSVSRIVSTKGKIIVFFKK